VALQEKWPYKRGGLTREVTLQEAVLVVIVWEVDLQQPVQSVPITIKAVISNPIHGKVYSMQHYAII
jgi:hypothetical protein